MFIKRNNLVIIIFLSCLSVILFTLFGVFFYNAYMGEGDISNRINSKISDVFHDQGYIYMSPVEPDTTDKVKLTLRTQRANVNRAQVLYTKDKGQTWNDVSMSYYKIDNTGYYDLWTCEIPPSTSAYTYRFAVSNNTYEAYVTSSGVTSKTPKSLESDFSVLPGFKTPDWTKGAVWYSVMPDSFVNGDIKNDKATSGNVQENAWGNTHFGGNDWFGGDLKGVSSKYGDYLKTTLNVDALFINPIWKADHNAGYGTFDIYQVDSALGTEMDLQNLTKNVHDNNGKIMLDAVFKYYAAPGTWFNESEYFPLKGAAQDRNSQFYNYFKFYQWPSQRETDWGQPVLDFASKELRDRIYSGTTSIMVDLLKKPYGIDGWRMDVGNTLWGSDRNAHQILKDMRNNLKKINDDAIFLSEHAGEADLFDYTLDSLWNYEFGYKIRDWSTGDTGQGIVPASLAQSLLRLPRPIALSSYNFLTTHDLSRINDPIADKPYLMNAAQILQMTYLGAPCIYFGDEIGMVGTPAPGVSEKAPTVFASMNWDESSWDYKIYNAQKALGELRKAYPTTLKTGVVKMLATDNKRQLITFARWDDKANIISVVSQNPEMVTYEIEARQASIEDGTVLVDYMTGNKYIVRNGWVTVDVMPGGAVLLNGEAGKYRNNLELVTTNGKGNINTIATNTYSLSGKASFTGKDDKYIIGKIPAFGDFEISALTHKSKGEVALMVRKSNNKDSAFYATTIDSTGEVTVTVRNKDNTDSKVLTRAKMNIGDFVKIARINDTFVVMTAKNVDGNPGQFVQIENTTCTIDLPHSILAGIVPVNDECKISSVEVKKIDGTLCQNFDSGVLGSMFDTIGDKGNFSVNDKQLTIIGSEQGSFAVGKLGYTDFTYKSKLTFKPSSSKDMAGVMVYQDKQNIFGAIRTMVDKKPVIAMGTIHNNKLAIYSMAVDSKPFENVTIQIQKTGSRYAAYYSYDEEMWQLVGKNLQANFCSLSVGVGVVGSLQATFDYVSFGDSIHGRNSASNSVLAGSIDVSFGSNLAAYGLCKLEIASGDWNYDWGGFVQKQTKGLAQMNYKDKSLGDFRTEVTFGLTGGNGFAAIGFRKSSVNGTLQDGYLLKVSKEGILSLSKKGSELGKFDVKKYIGKDIRLVIEAISDHIVVYLGEMSTPVIDVRDISYSKGYISYYMSDASGYLKNYGISDISTNWIVPKGQQTPGFGGILLSPSGKYGWSYLTGTTINDVAIGTNLQTSIAGNSAKGHCGFLLGANAGSTPDEEGLFVSIDTNGKLSISEKGKQLKSVQLTGDYSSLYLIVVAQEGKYQVFINDDTTPKLEYQEKITRGGTLSLYTEDCNAVFANLKVEALSYKQDYKQLMLYKVHAMAPNMNSMAKGTFKTSFNNASDMDNFMPYDGEWKIKSGEIQILSGSSWTGGAVLTQGKYKNFELTTKIKVLGGSGFMAICFRKNKPSDSHEMSGYMFYANGGAMAIYQNGKGEIAKGGTDWPNGQYATVRIVCKGNLIEVFVNNQKQMSVTSSDYGEGFISLNSGMATGSFDDFEIKTLP